MAEPIAGDDFVNQTIDNEGSIIHEPSPNLVGPGAGVKPSVGKTVGTTQSTSGMPLDTGDVATVVSADAGPVQVRIIDPNTPIEAGKQYYIVMTRGSSGEIIKRIGQQIPMDEFMKHFKAPPATQAPPATVAQAQAAMQQTQVQGGIPVQAQVQGVVQQQGGPPPLPAGWSQRTTPEGQIYYFNSVTGKSSFVHPSMHGEAQIQTTGTELADLLQDTWQKLTESEIRPIAFRYMMYAMTFGLCIGSIFRVGWCRIPGLNQSYCTYITLIMFSVAILILAALAYAREPQDAEVDLFDYWEVWVMIGAGAVAIIVMVMFNLRTSGITAYGDFGGSSGMGGMPGMAPGMTGFY